MIALRCRRASLAQCRLEHWRNLWQCRYDRRIGPDPVSKRVLSAGAHREGLAVSSKCSQPFRSKNRFLHPGKRLGPTVSRGPERVALDYNRGIFDERIDQPFINIGRESVLPGEA